MYHCTSSPSMLWSRIALLVSFLGLALRHHHPILPVVCAFSSPSILLSGLLGRRRYNARRKAITGLPNNKALHASNTTTFTTTSTSTTGDDDDQRLARAILLSTGDPTVDAPLPPAYTACPFSGIVGGAQSFYRIASQALHSPALFSFESNRKPNVEVSGGSAVRRLLNQEFTALTSNAVAGLSQIVCGTQSLRTVRDPIRHRALRDLVGVPLSPAAVSACIPRLQSISQQRIDRMASLPGQTLRAIELTQAIALDVTWQQVLGLQFQTEQEIETFHRYTYQWLRGIYSKPESEPFQAMLDARDYLINAIDSKVEALLSAGQSDGSTVGGLVFATLEDVDGGDDTTTADDGQCHQKQRLTKQQVIDNALLLILAATETTSSNLANVILLMALHPHVWERIVGEQKAIAERFGETITKDILDNHCPYLDATLQETLRILPVTLVSRRQVAETIVLDGQQIPKGWGVSYNIFLTHQRDPSVVTTGEDGDEEDPMDLMTGFQPARWLDPATRPSNKDYLPFGAGPRKCPGILLAKTEMKTFLSVFARSVRYEFARPIDTSQSIDSQISWEQRNTVPIPEDGVQIRIL